MIKDMLMNKPHPDKPAKTELLEGGYYTFQVLDYICVVMKTNGMYDVGIFKETPTGSTLPAYELFRGNFLVFENGLQSTTNFIMSNEAQMKIKKMRQSGFLNPENK